MSIFIEAITKHPYIQVLDSTGGVSFEYFYDSTTQQVKCVEEKMAELTYTYHVSHFQSHFMYDLDVLSKDGFAAINWILEQEDLLVVVKASDFNVPEDDHDDEDIVGF